MRIAVDAMGGDYAPSEIVKGAIAAVEQRVAVEHIYLVGDEAAIQREMPKGNPFPDKLSIVHASEVVGMDEAPAAAIRRKKDSSISRSVELVKSGDADAVFSAGNTGAAVAATTLKLRALEGVGRPAIATVMPTPVKPYILLDAGANTDCSPQLLRNFGIMGSVYSREILGVENPKVGILSIGGEQAKGNETTKEAFRLLEEAGVNFCGNIEGHDLYEGDIDVAVCDGFVGNVVLKTSESVAHAIGRWLKEEFMRNPITMMGAFLLRGAIKRIKRRGDPAMYGGAPLLGVNGVCIIGHGVSNAQAVVNAIRVASEWVKHDINHMIVDGVKAAKEGSTNGQQE